MTQNIPNQHRFWSYKTSHVLPLCRMATHPCDDDEGYSLWHMLALGLLRTDRAFEFLESTCAEKPGHVFDHLFESITKVPRPYIQRHYQLQSGAPEILYGPELIGLGLEQLCRIQGVSLLGHYAHEGVYRVRMNVAVTAFDNWIREELYGPLTPR